MAPTPRKFIKRLFQQLGLELRTRHICVDPNLQLAQALRHHEIDLVLDVGANQGQFSSELRANGYSGRIASFEPLTAAHKILKLTARGDRDWDIHDRIALGSTNTTTTINIASNSASSSLLDMLDLHVAASPKSVYTGREDVEVRRLDEIAPLYTKTESATLLKLDVQGYQREVLEGGVNTLRSSRAVLCELSLAPLYNGEQLWLETIGFLENHGFRLWSLFPGFVHPSTGQSLQIDGLFSRQ